MPGDEREGRPASETDRYLLALAVAERRRSPPVAPGHLADVLDRSPSAVTEISSASRSAASSTTSRTRGPR